MPPTSLWDTGDEWTKGIKHAAAQSWRRTWQHLVYIRRFSRWTKDVSRNTAYVWHCLAVADTNVAHSKCFQVTWPSSFILGKLYKAFSPKDLKHRTLLSKSFVHPHLRRMSQLSRTMNLFSSSKTCWMGHNSPADGHFLPKPAPAKMLPPIS